jgi:cell division transport system permease protein
VTKFRLILGESWRSLTSNFSTTLAATLTIVIAMFLLGLSIALGTLLISYGDSIKKQLEVNVYFCSSAPGNCGVDATKSDENAVAAQLSRDPRVRRWQFISKEEGIKIMRQKYPDMVKHLPVNPLGDRIRIIPKKGEYTEAIAQSLSPKPSGVQKIGFGKKETHTILSFAHAMEIGFIVAVSLLVIAATLLVGNTIRLSIFARRREIEVMKLVGATNWFVRGPFMLEGVITGVVGAVGAIALLLLGKLLILSRLPHGLRSGGDVQAISFTATALLIVAAGLLLGSLGPGLTIRRFLKI